MEILQFLQVGSVWLGFSIFALFLFLWVAKALKSHRFRPRAAWVYLGVLIAALCARIVFSPITLVHENHHGYELIRSSLSLSGYFFHGSTYPSFFYLASKIAGQSHQTIFAFNCALSVATALIVSLILQVLTRSLLCTLLAGMLFSLTPSLLRISCTESMFPLALFWGSSTILSLFLFFRNSDFRTLILCLSSACLAAQCRPIMFCITSVTFFYIAIHLFSLPPKEKRSAKLACLALACVSLVPVLVFRVADFHLQGIPSFVTLPSSSSLLALLSKSNLLFDASWLFPIVPVLAAANLIIQIRSRSKELRFLLVLVLTISLFLASTMSGSELDRLRLQSPMLLPVIILASLLPRYPAALKRLSVRLVSVVLILSGTLLHLHAHRGSIDRFYLPQTEFAFLTDPTLDLNPHCVIVLPDQYMANGHLCTEFPTWAYRQRMIRSSDWPSQKNTGQIHCAYYYLSLTCYLHTWQEAQGAVELSRVRDECLAVLPQIPNLATDGKNISGEMDVSYLRTKQESADIGFHCIYGLCEE